jgi:hypothetical protein
VTSEPHPFFVLLCVQFLELDPRIVKRLWQKLYPSEVQPLIVQAEFTSRSTGPEGVLFLAARLSPQLLLAACQRLAPVDGQRRDKAVTQAEEAILRRVGPDGRWA